MLNRKDPITAVTKLVDGCGQSSRLFFTASSATTNTAFQQFALDAWQQLHQFEFELKTELRRLGGMECVRKDFDLPRNSETVVRECGTTIEGLLECYREALNTTLSAHSRAMLNRQSQEIQKLQEQLLALKIAA